MLAKPAAHLDVNHDAYRQSQCTTMQSSHLVPSTSGCVMLDEIIAATGECEQRQYDHGQAESKDEGVKTLFIERAIHLLKYQGWIIGIIIDMRHKAPAGIVDKRNLSFTIDFAEYPWRDFPK